MTAPPVLGQFVAVFRELGTDGPRIAADAMDRLVLGIHAATDVGEPGTPDLRCTAHRRLRQSWPCDHARDALDRIAARESSTEER